MLLIQKKSWLLQLQLEEIKRLVKIGENDFDAHQKGQKQTGTKPIQKVTERHIAQDEEDEGRGETNTELLINYDNIDTVKNQNILEEFLN